jgi:hypothetical protein
VAQGAINAVSGSGRELASDVAHPLDTIAAMFGIDDEAYKRMIARKQEIESSPFIQNMPLGSEWWNKKATESGLPTTENTQPTTWGGKVLQQAVSAATAFAGPGVAGKLATAGGLPRVGEALSSISPGNPIGSAALGAVSGGTGEIAQEAANKEWPNSKIASEVARPLGEMAGALGPALGIEGARAVTPALTPSARKTATEQAGYNAAMGAASTPEASMDVLQQRLAADQAELIPGSKPTTAEVANDPGLLALQRARSRLSPNDSELGNALREQNISNNAARVQKMEGMAPANASPVNAQDEVRKVLENIDLAHQKTIDAEQQNAAMARAPITPTMTPEEQGQTARTAIEAERAPAGQALASAETAAQQKLSEATNQIGGEEAATTPQDIAFAKYGSVMRDPTQEGYLAERARLDQLRQSIDPNGTMGMRPDAIKQARQQLTQDFSPDMFGAMENKLYDRVDNWGNVIPIDDAFRLRADINARLKNVSDHTPQEAVRLIRLKGGIDQATNDAISDTQRLEDVGAINPGMPGINERFGNIERNTLGVGPNFAQDAARVYGSNPAALRAASRDETGRGILEAANQGNVALREGALPEGGISGSGTGGGSGSSPLDQGVPQTPALTPLTPEARAKFAQWNNEYAEMKRGYSGETAGQLHAVGKMLQKGGAYDSYKLSDEQVPWLVANGGKKAVDKFLAVAPPESQAALDDALSFSLRKSAMRSDGTLDLNQYQKWYKPLEGALSSRPELLEKFQTAKAAQEQLDGIQQALADHEKTYPLKPGWGESGILPQFWKAGPQGGESMRRYLQLTGSRPEAIEAARDYAALDFGNRAGVIKNGEVDPKAASAWIQQHQGALSELGVTDRYTNAVTAKQTLDDAISRHLNERNAFTKSVAGAFLQDDPERAVARLFSGTDRAQKAKTLMDVVSGNQAATEGVQKAVIDHLLSNFTGTAMAGGEHPTLMPTKLPNFIEQNKDVLTTVFSGSQQQWDALSADLERSTLAERAKMGAGSDTRELFSHAPPGAARSGITGLLMGLVGEHVGSHLLGWAAGGPLGAFAGLATKTALGAAKSAQQTAANHILDRMLLDPQFALEMHQTYGPMSAAARNTFMNRMKQRIMQSVLDASRANDLQPAHPQGYARGGSVKRATSGSVDSWRNLDVEAQGKHLADLADSLRKREQNAQEAEANAASSAIEASSAKDIAGTPSASDPATTTQIIIPQQVAA